MPIYKTGLLMFQKYQAKFDPTTIGNRFTQVKDVALARAQEGMVTIATIRDLVRPLLDQAGVTGGLRGTYIAFALALAKRTIRQKGDSAINIATGLKSYFVQAYGLNPDLCDRIVSLVVSWAGYY
uniref:Sulfolobus virus coat protein C-terminal domain-containing protein n=1 Tax=Ignisphaera aggregans TaxID=334771 RepID=A0A7J3JQ32_9CREN